MILEEIDLGEEKEDARRAVLENLGKEVIVLDAHFDWIHGTLVAEREDVEGYAVRSHDDPRVMKECCYHDLQTILRVHPYRE